jgi:hypothetical protein
MRVVVGVVVLGRGELKGFQLFSVSVHRQSIRPGALDDDEVLLS